MGALEDQSVSPATLLPHPPDLLDPKRSNNPMTRRDLSEEMVLERVRLPDGHKGCTYNGLWGQTLLGDMSP